MLRSGTDDCLQPPRWSASRRGSEEPPGRPRPPCLSRRLIPGQVSPGAPATLPPLTRPAPMRLVVSVGPVRICLTVRLAGRFGPSLPRCCNSRRDSVMPPGRPRQPALRASATVLQLSPGTPAIGPEVLVGQRPVAAWCALAQARIVRRSASPDRSHARPFSCDGSRPAIALSPHRPGASSRGAVEKHRQRDTRRGRAAPSSAPDRSPSTTCRTAIGRSAPNLSTATAPWPHDVHWPIPGSGRS